MYYTTGVLCGTLPFTDIQGLVRSLRVPAKSVDTPATLTIRPHRATGTATLGFAGQAVVVTLAGAESFTQPALLSLRYSRAYIRLISDRDQLMLYQRVAGEWLPVGDTCTAGPLPVHNQAVRELQVAICTPGEYALLGPTVRLHLPFLAR